MPLVVPNPTVPTNGQALDATPLLANLNAVYQAIQSFDGSQIQAGTVQAAAMAAAVNPNTLLNDTIQPFVQSGLLWSTVSGLNGTMTGGVMYVRTPANLILRVTVNSVGSNTFAANKDVYVYIDYNGNISYNAVANNAASPSAVANAVLVAIIVTGASAISFINQGQVDITLASFGPSVSGAFLSYTDSLGNIIYPTSPNPQMLGFRAINTTFSTTSATVVGNAGLNMPIQIFNTSRKIKVRAYAPYLYNSTSGQRANFSLHDAVSGSVAAGNLIAEGHGFNNNSASAGTGIVEKIFNPSATGLKTYSTGLASSAAATTATADISTNSQIYMVAEYES